MSYMQLISCNIDTEKRREEKRREEKRREERERERERGNINDTTRG